MKQDLPTIGETRIVPRFVLKGYDATVTRISRGRNGSRRVHFTYPGGEGEGWILLDSWNKFRRRRKCPSTSMK